MNTKTNLLKQILANSGGDVDSLPNNLLSTHYESIITALGGNVEELPNRLKTTYLRKIAELISGGSSGGSGNGMTVLGAELYAVYDGQLYDIQSLANGILSGYVGVNTAIAVVDELPDVMSEYTNAVFITKADGLKYCHEMGMWMGFPEVIMNNGDDDIPDCGWIDKSALESLDYTDSANNGFYAVEKVCNPYVERNLVEYVGNDKRVGESAFAKCSALVSVDLPNATIIGDNAFDSCMMLHNVNIPNATIIGYRAFNGCYTLLEVTLTEAKTIGDSAFAGCYNELWRVDLPCVTSIGDNAFGGCSCLSDLYIRTPSVCVLGSDALSDTYIEWDGGYIYVPANLVDEYKRATNWSRYADQIMPIEE